MSINWQAIRKQYDQMMEVKRYTPGLYYRAVTFDGDIFDGELTYYSRNIIELRLGNHFKSFNRGITKFVKLSPSLDCQ